MDISAEGIAFKQEKTNARLLVQMTPDLEELIARVKALPRKIRFHHWASMGSWAMRSRKRSHSVRGNTIKQPWGCFVMVN